MISQFAEQKSTVHMLERRMAGSISPRVNRWSIDNLIIPSGVYTTVADLMNTAVSIVAYIRNRTDAMMIS